MGGDKVKEAIDWIFLADESMAERRFDSLRDSHEVPELGSSVHVNIEADCVHRGKILLELFWL